MKKSSYSLLLPTMLLMGTLCIWFGYAMRGNQQVDNLPTEPVVKPSVETEVIPLKDGKGFRYRGLLIDIDTDPNGGGVNIGPQWRYRMGYNDGYYGYEVNPKYADSYQYMRGHREGAAARQAIR